ncbi:MAG: hypothetical protein WD733_10325 [Bryobacterales bacterium]
MRLSSSSISEFAEFEQIWHPEYSRYAEHCFNHLINLLLAVFEVREGKQYRNQTLANRVEVLRSKGLEELCAGFNARIRNAVAHGTIEFRDFGVRYIDRVKAEEIPGFQFFEFFDDLVSTCHSIVIGLLIALMRVWPAVRTAGFQRLPLGVRFLGIRGECTHRYFELVRLTPSSLAGQNQMMASVRSRFADREWHMREALFLSAQIQDFGAESVERIGVSIDCGKSVPASVFVRNQALLRFRLGQDGPEEIIDADLLWYKRRLKSRKLLAYRMILPLVYERIARNYWREMQETTGWVRLGSLYEIRDVRNVSSTGHRRLEAVFTLKDPRISEDRQLLRRIIKHAVTRLRRNRMPLVDFGATRGLPLRPKYVFVRGYQVDKCLRRLDGHRIRERNALFRAEWIGVRKRPALFVKSPHEFIGSIRVMWYDSTHWDRLTAKMNEAENAAD